MTPSELKEKRKEKGLTQTELRKLVGIGLQPDELREKRLAVGFTQTELANLVGRTLNTIQKYENGSPMDEVIQYKLLTALGEDPKCPICGGENDGTEREMEQDKYTHCWKNDVIDQEDHVDKHDIMDTISVLSQGLSIAQHKERNNLEDEKVT